MTSDLERRYHRLLRVYPKAWRVENETALLATLDEAALPGQKRPTMRESRSLIANGLRNRVRSSSVDRSSALRQGLIWGSMAWLSFYACLPIGWDWQRQNSPVNYWPSLPLAAIAVMVGYPIAVLRPSKKFFTLLGTLCTGGLLFDWLNAPTTQGLLARNGAAASAVIVLPCLVTLRWCSQVHTKASLRRSRWWLALPIFGLASGYTIIILCATLTLVVGALGAARFDPRAPIAAAFIMGTMYLSEYTFLMSSSRGIDGSGISDQRALLILSFQLLVLPAAIIGPLVVIIRRHARAVFTT
jgi:hypothetical protein